MTVQTVPTFRRMAVPGPACRIKGSEASLHFYQTFVRSQLGISRDLRLRRLYSRDRCRGGARSPFLSPCSVPGSEGMWHFCAESAWDFSRPPPTSPIQPRPLWQRRPIPVPFPLFSAGVGGMWHLGVAGRDQFVRAQHPMCKAAEKSMAEA